MIFITLCQRFSHLKSILVLLSYALNLTGGWNLVPLPSWFDSYKMYFLASVLSPEPQSTPLPMYIMLPRESFKLDFLHDSSCYGKTLTCINSCKEYFYSSISLILVFLTLLDCMLFAFRYMCFNNLFIYTCIKCYLSTMHIKLKTMVFEFVKHAIFTVDYQKRKERTIITH